MDVQTAPPNDKAPTAPKKSRLRAMAGWKKALLGLCVLLLLLAGGVAAGGYLLYRRYDTQVQRQDLLGTATTPQEAEQRDQNWSDGPLNLLLLGSDSRATTPGGDSPIGERSDTIMLLHIAKSRDRAAIISIPRDSYVDVPPGGDWNGGKNKINAAFSFGGVPLAAEAVQNLTGIRLDGAMIANFASIHTIVDAVGGVNVCVPYDVQSTFSAKLWTEGCHHMAGAETEEFMRQRYNVPDGDFGRMKDQQLVVKAIVTKVASGDTLSNPLKFDKLLVTVAGALTVDKDLDLRALALAVKGIRPGAVKFATVPHSNAALKTKVGTAVQLAKTESAAMFAAIKNDTIDQYLTEHP